MRLVAALGAAFLLVGCENPPTQVDDAAVPDLRAAQGDRSDWVLAYEATLTESDGYMFGPAACMGEESVNFGTYGVYFKAVNTPSGHVISQGWITSAADTYRGMVSGDLWIGTLDAKYREFTRKQDGHLILMEPVTQVITNQRTGARIRYQALFRLELDEDGQVVPTANFRVAVVQCHRLSN
ncbi:MAG: hypothetical protein OEY20_13115 [Gemmatimonadota bacterium]|nr:hypothetical protein [Gemmatimonadota bacterium]MDH4352024.1 hypothetical protein [Gemmatimonadota bacterium]MDH5198176.1 hypothetical protein [Gemmatimonadota bacterium]